jgi:hypothetical protein
VLSRKLHRKFQTPVQHGFGSRTFDQSAIRLCTILGLVVNDTIEPGRTHQIGYCKRVDFMPETSPVVLVIEHPLAKINDFHDLMPIVDLRFKTMVLSKRSGNRIFRLS